jgi:hypothetical protein
MFKEQHDMSENKTQKYAKPYAVACTVYRNKRRKSEVNELALFHPLRAE